MRTLTKVRALLPEVTSSQCSENFLTKPNRIYLDKNLL